MSKKAKPRNAFYFYMIDYKEEMKKKGIIYSNLADVAQVAGQLWKDLPDSAKAKYVAKAKKDKQDMGGLECKFTSTGISYAELQRRENAKIEAEDREEKYIMNFIKRHTVSNTILETCFYLADVNYYCKTSDGYYLIGEYTILRFNIRDGIIDHYHKEINPHKIPFGYTSDVKLGCQEFGLKMPDESEPPTDLMMLLSSTIDYLERSGTGNDHVIYTMPDKVEAVSCFFWEMCNSVDLDFQDFRFYKLNTLFYHLANSFSCGASQLVFPKKSIPWTVLKKDSFMYTPGIACEMHEANDKSNECTLARTKRWAYTLLDYICPLCSVQAIPGNHVPVDYDLDAIAVVRAERTIVSPRSRVAGECDCTMSSINTSLQEVSLDAPSSSTFFSTAGTSHGSKSTSLDCHVRMPKTKPAIRAVPPPFDPKDGPGSSMLSLGSIGRGRGRGVAPPGFQ